MAGSLLSAPRTFLQDLIYPFRCRPLALDIGYKENAQPFALTHSVHFSQSRPRYDRIIISGKRFYTPDDSSMYFARKRISQIRDLNKLWITGIILGLWGFNRTTNRYQCILRVKIRKKKSCKYRRINASLKRYKKNMKLRRTSLYIIV